jgi:hypothetical protein
VPILRRVSYPASVPLTGSDEKCARDGSVEFVLVCLVKRKKLPRCRSATVSTPFSVSTLEVFCIRPTCGGGRSQMYKVRAGLAAKSLDFNVRDCLCS